MARVVNLRTRRKQKARDTKRKETTGPAAPASGVSRGERARAEAENRLLGQRLEGHRLDTPEPDQQPDPGTDAG